MQEGLFFDIVNFIFSRPYIEYYTVRIHSKQVQHWWKYLRVFQSKHFLLTLTCRVHRSSCTEVKAFLGWFKNYDFFLHFLGVFIGQKIVHVCDLHMQSSLWCYLLVWNFCSFQLHLPILFPPMKKIKFHLLASTTASIWCSTSLNFKKECQDTSLATNVHILPSSFVRAWDRQNALLCTSWQS